MAVAVLEWVGSLAATRFTYILGAYILGAWNVPIVLALRPMNSLPMFHPLAHPLVSPTSRHSPL